MHTHVEIKKEGKGISVYREAAKTRKNERRRILGAVSNIAFGPRPQGEKKRKENTWHALSLDFAHL